MLLRLAEERQGLSPAVGDALDEPRADMDRDERGAGDRNGQDLPIRV